MTALSEFRFSDQDDPGQMLESFYVALRDTDPEFGQLVELAVKSLLPLPESGPDRNTRRGQINGLLRQRLQQLAAEAGGR
jgi:hypothetical protein